MKSKASLNLSKPHEGHLDGTYRSEPKESSFSKEACQNDSNEPTWKCRHVVVLFGCLIQLSMALHRVAMSVTIVAMVNSTGTNQEETVISDSCPDLIKNLTVEEILHRSKTEGGFIWSPKLQGYILSSFFISFMIMQVPSGRLQERYGSKWFIFVSSLATAILTMTIPPISQFGASAVIVMQSLRGIAQGFLGPCCSILMTNWCPKHERGFVCSIVQSMNQLGHALGDGFVGYMSESGAGWPFVFYSIGISGIVFSVCVWIFLVENPKDHTRISKAELNFILSHQECTFSRKRPKLPWREILTSVPTYALWFAIFGRFWTFAQFLTVHSLFLGTILHYPIKQNGLLSAAPFLLAFVTAICSSSISGYIQKKNIVSVDVLRKFFVFFSSLGVSASLFGLYISGCNRNLSVFFAILCMGMSGLGGPGCLIVATDMAPTFAGTIQSIGAVLGFLPNVLMPVIVGHLTEGNQTLEQWNKVFFLSIGVVMSSAIVFVIFGSAEIQPWNFVKEEDEKQSEVNTTDKVTKF